MFDSLPILSIIAYTPLAGALVILLFMRKAGDVAVRNWATGVAFVDFLISVPLWWEFDR